MFRRYKRSVINCHCWMYLCGGVWTWFCREKSEEHKERYSLCRKVLESWVWRERKYLSHDHLIPSSRHSFGNISQMNSLEQVQDHEEDSTLSDCALNCNAWDKLNEQRVTSSPKNYHHHLYLCEEGIPEELANIDFTALSIILLSSWSRHQEGASQFIIYDYKKDMLSAIMMIFRVVEWPTTKQKYYRQLIATLDKKRQRRVTVSGNIRDNDYYFLWW